MHAAAVRAIERGESPAPLWARLEESGFVDALVPEDAGGAGLRLADVFPLLRRRGRHALPLPLAQTMLARALLAEAARIPELAAHALRRPRRTLGQTAVRLPGGRRAARRRLGAGRTGRACRAVARRPTARTPHRRHGSLRGDLWNADACGRSRGRQPARMTCARCSAVR